MSHHPTIPQYATWAHSALQRKPDPARDMAGISREDVSKRAQAICYVAGQTGQTLRAWEYLTMLSPMLVSAALRELAPPRRGPLQPPRGRQKATATRPAE